MSPLGTIKTYANNPRVAKAEIAAAYNGFEFKIEEFDLANRTPEFFAKFPMGQVPAFESAEVNLFESSAIAYYAAAKKEDSSLLGKTAVEKALIIQWVLFAENELIGQSYKWITPHMGFTPYLKPNVDAAFTNFKRALGALDKVLLTKTYLVGNEVTFADICVVTSIVPAFTYMLNKENRAEFKNVLRYFNTLVAKPHFKKALGEVKLCETPLQYTAAKKETKKKEVKKEAPKKKEEPKKKAEPKDDEDDEPKPAPKVKSKLDLLPPSPFIMDAWKREYSNNDTKDSIKWFWEHFDPVGYSIWKVDYKYNEELTKTFMSNNLIGGFYARLERAHKYAFGSMIVRGVDNNNNISGYFVVRGQEVPFEIYDAADYPSFNFQKIEPAQYEEKKQEIFNYFAWEFPDFVDGKVFK
ncbi:hypothetical protein BDB01DRAFT_843428 [Pilobolus umbonatus]|nr:hypothetical protein BDB01DRAFT_843428 [Pilobolus umbonatus]